jgi:hypothetical protein
MGHETSSIHIRPVKDMAQLHFKDEHRQKLDYIRSDRIDLNESWRANDMSLIELDHSLRSLVKEKTKRSMQKKAAPIREGVINLKDETTMDDLKDLSSSIEERFKVRAIQIHIHEDEGHTDPHTHEWRQNRHAHMVFDWIDHETGKSIKLDQMDMRDMQNIVAESLKMERGEMIQYDGKTENGKRLLKKKGERRHLPPLEYKRHQEHLRTQEAKQVIKYRKGFGKKALGKVDVKNTTKSIDALIRSHESNIEDITSDRESEVNDLRGVVANLSVERNELKDELVQEEYRVHLAKEEGKKEREKGIAEMSKFYLHLLKKKGLMLDMSDPKNPDITPIPPKIKKVKKNERGI